MSNVGGYAVARTHPESRFYHPPHARRHQQQLLLQPHQQVNGSEALVDSAAAEPDSHSGPTELDEESPAASSRRPSNLACSPSVQSRGESCLTNLDRLIEAVTPSVRAHYFDEVRTRRLRTSESDLRPYYFLEDLWESFREWSVYGVGVPLLLNQGECVKQYYVPSLSGIQLYIDPARPRRSGEDADAETSRETSSGGSSDCEVERRATSVTDASSNLLMSLNSHKMNRLTIRDKTSMSSSSDEAEVCNYSGSLVFHYVEQEQPHHRKPFYDKVSILASQFPDLKRYRSCDILPTSWISVAWYPIYRIPVGPTLQNLDASFLTFHSLSTHPKSKFEPQLHVPSGRRVHGAVSYSKFSVPIFGLASYKLKGSILTAGGMHERQQANKLLQAADDWLQKLQVNLPDYQFFVSHSSQWR